MAEVVGARSMAEIRDDILTDVVLESAKAGIEANVGPGSDEYILATGVAGACMLLHARIDGAKDACTPLRAQGEDLERHQEARGVPDAEPSRAAGKVRLTVTGTSSVPDGQAGTLANGARFSVVGTWSPVANGSEVDVLVDEPGTKGNAKGGAAVTLLNPPTNVSQEAAVSKFAPLTGGFGEESQEQLRERVVNDLATNPGGGSWGQLRQIALDTSPAVQMAFVYPTLGGPGTQKVVAMKLFDRELLSFSRVMPEGTLEQIRANIHGEISTGVSTIVQASADQPTDATVRLTLPASSLAGGSGEGWLDLLPWPALEGVETVCTVTSVSAAGLVILNADTTVEPVPGQTRVAWWSPRDMAFHVRLVTSFDGVAGAWELTPDTPWIDSTGEGPVAGDYMCPAAENMAGYSKTWTSLFEGLGAGENTSDAGLTASGRALRHPFIAERQQHRLTFEFLKQLSNRHPEITDAAWQYRQQSAPTVPGTLAEAPNVLTPNRFALYPT